MSVCVMEKLTVVVPRRDADDLVRALMRLRAVSLTPAEDADLLASLAPETDVPASAARVAEIEAVLPVLSRRSTRKKSLFGTQTPFSPADFVGEGKDVAAQKVVEETKKILAKQAELKQLLEDELAREAALTPYLSLAMPLSFAGTESTALLLGSLPPGVSPQAAAAQLEELAADLRVISEDAAGTYILLLVHKDHLSAAEHALASLGFARAPFTDKDKTAAQLYSDSQREVAALHEAADRLEKRLAALAEHVGEVELLYDLARTALLVEEAKRRLSATEECAVLTGWCPKRAHARIERALSRFTAAYEFAPPREDEEPPVKLANNGFAKNFEWVLGMYAYPKYGSFDPTFVMSIFYFLIFGLMFADAGYGLVLSLACFLLVRFARPPAGMRRFLLMFGFCGISSLIFGVLFGSYFGNFPLAFLENVAGRAPQNMPHLSYLASTDPNVAILFDPLQNPMVFLVLSLGVGAVHLIAGMAVRAFTLCRNGRPLDALFDIGSYWLLFAGIGVFFLKRTVGLYLLIGGAVAIILTQGRHRKGIPMKLVGGLGGIYNLINYASDLLSYSRILALGLATAVIAQVINVMATLKGATFVGFVMMIAVFLIGHVLNIVINLIGTFVHTARLQYIEFFGKFYEEGGTPFVPMAPSDRYSLDTTPEEATPSAKK